MVENKKLLMLCCIFIALGVMYETALLEMGVILLVVILSKKGWEMLHRKPSKRLFTKEMEQLQQAFQKKEIKEFEYYAKRDKLVQDLNDGKVSEEE